MGARAQVDELAVLVERDLLALGNVGQPAELVALLAARPDDLRRLPARDLLPHKRLVLVGDLLHLGLDPHQVLGGELVLEIDVVVEPGVGRGTDVQLRIGIDAKERRRQDVRRRVAEFFEGGHEVGLKDGRRPANAKSRFLEGLQYRAVLAVAHGPAGRGQLRAEPVGRFKVPGLLRGQAPVRERGDLRGAGRGRQPQPPG